MNRTLKGSIFSALDQAGLERRLTGRLYTIFTNDSLVCIEELSETRVFLEEDFAGL